MVSVSIIIVTHNRQEMLQALLKSISINGLFYEIIIVNNSTVPINIAEFEVKIINRVHSTPGDARNSGVKEASHDWILFLDDDVTLPDNYFDKNIKYLLENQDELDMIGGPDQTPLDAGFFPNCLGLALQSPMATAKTRLRHSKDILRIKSGDEKNLILCNLWVRKKFLQKNKIIFNKNFFRNEENILITESLRCGARAIYSSDFYVYHSRKSNLAALSRSTFSSGKFRAKSFFYAKELFDPLFLIPSVLVLYLLTFPLLLRVSNYFLLPLFVYFFLGIMFSVIAAKGSLLKAIFIWFYQMVINILYGLGVLYGLTLNRLNIRSRLSL